MDYAVSGMWLVALIAFTAGCSANGLWRSLWRLPRDWLPTAIPLSLVALAAPVALV